MHTRSFLFVVWILFLAGCASHTDMSTQNSLPRTPASKGAKANLGARQNYVLRSTDLIQVEVFQEEDLYKEVRVAADGMIVLPLIGKVKVAGMTVSEAQEKIRELYDQKYLVDPQINLLVIQYAPRRVQVLGQVNQPGYVIIPPEEEMTLAQAISGAHGMTLRADPKNVKIKRVADGKTKVFTINFNEILRNPEAKDVYVHDGDTIYVEERLF